MHMHVHTYTHTPTATSQTSPCYHAELFHQILVSFTWHLIHVLYQDSSHSVLVCMFCWLYLIICNCSFMIRARPWSSYNTLNAGARIFFLIKGIGHNHIVLYYFENIIFLVSQILFLAMNLWVSFGISLKDSYSQFKILWKALWIQLDIYGNTR